MASRAACPALGSARTGTAVAREGERGVKRSSDFGRGYATCLRQFTFHRTRLAEQVASAAVMRTMYPDLFGDESAAETWANGSSDHLYELVKPRRGVPAAEWQQARVLADRALDIGHGYRASARPQRNAKACWTPPIRFLRCWRAVVTRQRPSMTVSPRTGPSDWRPSGVSGPVPKTCGGRRDPDGPPPLDASLPPHAGRRARGVPRCRGGRGAGAGDGSIMRVRLPERAIAGATTSAASKSVARSGGRNTSRSVPGLTSGRL